MTYNVMDPLLMEIYGIKNLEFIKFYDLTLNDDDKQIVVPALLISYDNGKMLNLDIKDKYFDIYVNKVIEVYQMEKGKVLHDTPFGKVHIMVDDNTKRILENGNLLNKKKITSFYNDKDHYDHSLTFESDEIKSIIDIIRYEIKSFGEFANLNISLSDNIRGYRTNYVLEAKINNLFTYLLIHYEKLDDNNYQISIGNLGGANNNFIINISFHDDYIDITCLYKDLLFNDMFNINQENASFIRRIVRNNELLKMETGLLEKVNPEELNIINLDGDIENVTWYRLPWSSYYGYSENVEIIHDNDIMASEHIIYVDINNDNFCKRDYYIKQVYRDSTVSKVGLRLTLDELRKITYGFKNGAYYIIETGFKNARGDGVYQEKFNGKYYYHIVKAKKLREIKKENLRSISKSIINDKEDLLSDIKLKTLGGNL